MVGVFAYLRLGVIVLCCASIPALAQAHEVETQTQGPSAQEQGAGEPARFAEPSARFLAELSARLLNGGITCRQAVREIDKFLAGLEAQGGGFTAYMGLRMAQNRLDYRHRSRAAEVLQAVAADLERARLTHVAVAQADPSS